MNKIEQVRAALTKALGFTDSYQTHGLDERYRAESSDVYDKLRAALAILKDMDGQEPVAWMYKGGDSRYPAYLTLEKDIAEEDADDPSSIIPLYAHPSPSAPVDIAEIIAAGDAMSRALMLNERYNVDGGLDEGMNRIDIECSNAWTTATAKHRTA